MTSTRSSTRTASTCCTCARRITFTRGRLSRRSNAGFTSSARSRSRSPAKSANVLIAAAEQHKLVNAVCYHTRTYPLVEHMRAEVEAGAIGEITFVHGRYLCDDVLFPASGWRVDPAQSGPAYVVGDLGTHWLDLAEHVTGQHVSEVLADFRSFAGGPLEDYAALLLRFGGGAAGSVVLSAGAAGRKNQLLFEVEGTHRRLHLGSGASDGGALPAGRRPEAGRRQGPDDETRRPHGR